MMSDSGHSSAKLPDVGTPPPRNDLELLVVRIDSERYAIPLPVVRRVLAAVRVTRLPGAPASVSGVVDMHGTLTPVFDLRHRLGLPSRDVDADDHFVVMTVGEGPVILHVDQASEVAVVDEAELRQPAELGAALEHIAGIARLPRGLVLIHDPAAFLSDAEATQLDEAFARHRGRPES